MTLASIRKEKERESQTFSLLSSPHGVGYSPSKGKNDTELTIAHQHTKERDE